MKISVIIPAYNGEKFIRQCLQSVLSQSRQPDQIAVVIDESHDGTQAICEEFADQIEIYHNSPATGFVDAWNRAICKAKNEWICLLHQDDLLTNDFLEKVETIINAEPDCRYIYGRCNYIDNSGKVYWSPKIEGPEWEKQTGFDYIMSYMKGDANRCPGVIAHREVFDNIPFRREPGLVADNDFFWRVGFQYDVVRVNAIVASFRHHPDSATYTFKNLDASMFEEYMWLYQDYEKIGMITKFPSWGKILFEWILRPYRHYSFALLRENRISDFLAQKRKIQDFIKPRKNEFSGYPYLLRDRLCIFFPWIFPWLSIKGYSLFHRRK